MFLSVYNHLKAQIVMFLISQNEPFISTGASSTEPAMLNFHGAEKPTKHWFPKRFLMSFVATP